MEKFKKVVDSNNPEKITETIKIIENQWSSIGDIERATKVLDAQTRTQILSGTNTNTFNGDTLSEIYKLRLPSYMSWDYYVLQNQWNLYWVNRNEIICDDNNVKQAFKLAISIGRKYGRIAVKKENEDYVIGVLSDKEYTASGKLAKAKFIPSFYANKYGYIDTISDKKLIKWSKDIKPETINLDNYITFAPRENELGDFVYCMKDLLIDIYLKTMIQSNASNLQDKMFVTVANPRTLPCELAINRNPFIPYGIKIEDNQSGEGSNEYKFSESKGGEHAYINTLIETLKHHQEYYYAKYGRPISSNKAQALSSDSSLSISSAEAIANDWDERVMMFADLWNKTFNTNIRIEKPELNIAPQNENADKEGLGQALTEGDTMNKKAERGE